MGYLLLIIASILKWVLTPVAYGYGVVCSLSRGEFSEYNRQLAIAKDQYGNGLCRYLFNQVLITGGGYKFGCVDETISSVIGKNKQIGTLTRLGRWVDAILDSIDENHSIKSIDLTENDQT